MAYASIDEVFGSDWNLDNNTYEENTNVYNQDQETQVFFDASQNKQNNNQNNQNYQNNQNNQNYQTPTIQYSQHNANNQDTANNISYNHTNSKYPENKYFQKENAFSEKEHVKKNSQSPLNSTKFPPLQGEMLGSTFEKSETSILNNKNSESPNNNFFDISSKNNTIFSNKIDELINVLSKNNCTNWTDVFVFISLGILCIIALEMFFKFGRFVVTQRIQKNVQSFNPYSQIPSQMSQIPSQIPQIPQMSSQFSSPPIPQMSSQVVQQGGGVFF
jgi:hypothetical protein